MLYSAEVTKRLDTFVSQCVHRNEMKISNTCKSKTTRSSQAKLISLMFLSNDCCHFQLSSETIQTAIFPFQWWHSNVFVQRASRRRSSPSSFAWETSLVGCTVSEGSRNERLFRKLYNVNPSCIVSHSFYIVNKLIVQRFRKTIEFALNYFALTLVQDIAWRIVQRRKVLLVETVR